MSGSLKKSIEDWGKVMEGLESLKATILDTTLQTAAQLTQVKNDAMDQEHMMGLLMEHAAGLGREVNRITEENKVLRDSIRSLTEKVEQRDQQIRELANAVEGLKQRS